MMRMRLSALQILLVMLLLRKECKGISCYQCSSAKDEDCTINKVDQEYVKPCPPTHSYCRKVIDIYYFTGSKEYHTIRECAKLADNRKGCYRGRYTHDSYQLTCECKEDRCNWSIRSSPWIVLHVLCLFLLFFVLSPT